MISPSPPLNGSWTPPCAGTPVANWVVVAVGAKRVPAKAIDPKEPIPPVPLFV